MAEAIRTTEKSSLRVVPWAILGCLLWSSAFAMVKIGLDHMPPLTFAGMRFLLAGLILVPFCGKPKAVAFALRRQKRLILWVSFLQTILLYGTFFVGMNLVRGAQGAIIVGASPLASALLAHRFMTDDRITAGKACSIALGIVGVAVLACASKPWSPTGMWQVLGMGLLMVGVFSSAVSGILVARSRRAISPMLLASLQMGFGGAVLLVIAVVFEDLPREMPPLHFFVSLAWLAFVSATAFSIWFYWLRRVKVSELNMWKFLVPVFGVIISWVLLSGESPDWITVVCMVCVAGAVLLNQLQARRNGKVNEKAVSRPI